MKKILILVVLGAVLAGGAYYYWEIYRLPGVVIDLTIIFGKDFGEAMQKVEASRPKDSDDYAAILSGIEATKGDFESVEKRLSSIWPPSKIKDIHKAMLEVVRFLRSGLAKAETKARFMSELSDMIRSLIPKEMDKKLGPNAMVSDLANLWTDAIPKMKSKGEALFAGETVSLNGTTFEELKLKWSEARDNFDIILVLMRAQNQKLPVRDFRLDQVKMTDRERGSFQKASAFMELVDRTIRENSAYDITRGDSGGKSFQEEFSNKNSNLNDAFKKFSDENPELVKQLEVEIKKRGLK